MKTRLQEYALVAEIISALCIVLSLIFVGLQVRQGAEETAINSTSMRGSVQQAMMQTDIGILSLAEDYPGIIRGLNITEENQDQAFLFAIAMVRSRENYWHQYNKGLLDEETYHAYTNVLVRMITNSEYYASQWEGFQMNGNYVQGFIDDTNVLVAETSGID